MESSEESEEGSLQAKKSLETGPFVEAIHDGGIHQPNGDPDGPHHLHSFPHDGGHEAG
jgi:hypothetical protein